GPDAVELWHGVIRQFVGGSAARTAGVAVRTGTALNALPVWPVVRQGQAPTTMTVAHDSALFLPPLQHRKCEAGPLFDEFGAGIVVFLQPQQTQMPRVR